MGMKDYTDTEGTSDRNKILEKIEPYINTIIYLECAMKIIAMGFVLGKNTYLKDGWNVLDFIVVLASVLASVAKLLSDSENHVPARGI